MKKPAAKGKAKASPKTKATKGKAGRPKKSEHADTEAKKKMANQKKKKAEEEKAAEETNDPTEEENTSKPEKKSMFKRPAASATAGSTAPMKRPSAAHATLRVWKYQYSSGVYGFKDSRSNKEVLRVGVAKYVSICLFCVLNTSVFA